ncbi:MAG: RNA polymerase subunit sigma-70 [Pirellulales bacterium]|nr:RNA polymerase subunit sigma-70 [Pirellulales bacterium]
MSQNSQVSELLIRVRKGDDDAAQVLWDKYFLKLVRRATDELGRHNRMADGEDAALSAFNSFLKGMTEGEFNWLRNRQDLWRLLVTITVRKAWAQLRHEHREKRGGGGVFGESAFMAGKASSQVPGINGVDAAQAGGAELTPEDVVMLREEYTRLLNTLPEGAIRETAELLLLYGDKYDKKEMAQQMNCSVRTIERRCNDIVSILSTRQDRSDLPCRRGHQ